MLLFLQNCSLCLHLNTFLQLGRNCILASHTSGCCNTDCIFIKFCKNPDKCIYLTTCWTGWGNVGRVGGARNGKTIYIYFASAFCFTKKFTLRLNFIIYGTNQLPFISCDTKENYSIGLVFKIGWMWRGHAWYENWKPRRELSHRCLLFSYVVQSMAKQMLLFFKMRNGPILSSITVYLLDGKNCVNWLLSGETFSTFLCHFTVK